MEKTNKKLELAVSPTTTTEEDEPEQSDELSLEEHVDCDSDGEISEAESITLKDRHRQSTRPIHLVSESGSLLCTRKPDPFRSLLRQIFIHPLAAE